MLRFSVNRTDAISVRTYIVISLHILWSHNGTWIRHCQTTTSLKWKTCQSNELQCRMPDTPDFNHFRLWIAKFDNLESQLTCQSNELQCMMPDTPNYNHFRQWIAKFDNWESSVRVLHALNSLSCQILLSDISWNIRPKLHAVLVNVTSRDNNSYLAA